MPVVAVKMAKGRSLEVKRRLVAEITKVITDTLDVKQEWVTVLLDEYERENWSSGGSLHVDLFGEEYGQKGS